MLNKKSGEGNVDLRRVARRPYAVPGDFCAIFEEEMNTLYSLALLLTGEHQAAEACFVSALEDCRNGTDVFREWARSWSRRAIVKQAIRRVHPRPNQAAQGGISGAASIAGVLFEMATFERFVFAMTVLEHYSVRESAMLLDCSIREVEAARIRALQFIAAASRAIPVQVAPGREFLPAAVA